MKIPFLDDTRLSDLLPTDAKTLLCACSHARWRTTLEQASIALGTSTQTLRRSLRRLVDAGLIVVRRIDQGLLIIPLLARRFTYVPGEDPGVFARLSVRAAKALIAVCRGADNKTLSLRMRVGTLAKRLGRSIRTAVLALCELRARGLIDTFRTGRSSWITIRKTEYQGELFEPKVAHRADLLLRLLCSTKEELLAQTLSRIKTSTQGIREVAVSLVKPAEKSRALGLLVVAGQSRANATGILGAFLPAEVLEAVDRLQHDAQRGRARLGRWFERPRV